MHESIVGVPYPKQHRRKTGIAVNSCFLLRIGRIALSGIGLPESDWSAARRWPQTTLLKGRFGISRNNARIQ